MSSALDIDETQSRAADPKYGEELVEVSQVSECLQHAYLLRCSWDVPSRGDPVQEHAGISPDELPHVAGKKETWVSAKAAVPTI